jgi:hypothetical protein
MTPTFGCDHLRGGRVLRPRSPPPPSGGEGGPLLASDVLARCGWGRSGTCSYALVAPDVLAVQHCESPVLSPRPPWPALRWPCSLRSASARRRRPGSTRRAASASPLHLSGPVGPARIPGLPLLDHRGGCRLRSAPQARGGAAGVDPGARPAPHRFASRAPWARLGAPRSLSSISASLFVRAGRSGPPPRRRRSAVTTSGGDVCSAPGHPPTPPVGGGRGGRGPLLASDVLARCGWERSGTCSYALVAQDVLAVQHSNANRYHPSGDKQVSLDEATPPTCCVIVSRDRGSPDRVEFEELKSSESFTTNHYHEAGI